MVRSWPRAASGAASRRRLRRKCFGEEGFGQKKAADKNRTHVRAASTWLLCCYSAENM